MENVIDSWFNGEWQVVVGTFKIVQSWPERILEPAIDDSDGFRKRYSIEIAGNNYIFIGMG